MALKYLQVGAIKENKAKTKLYINLNQSTNNEGKYVNDNLIELYEALGTFIENPDKNGVSLQIEKPKDKIRKLCALGYIDEADLEKRLNQIPDYIHYEISFVKEV